MKKTEKIKELPAKSTNPEVAGKDIPDAPALPHEKREIIPREEPGVKRLTEVNRPDNDQYTL